MPDYERIERLGEGNFGEVWLVYDRALGVKRAVKYVTASRIHDPTNFYQEPRALMALRHDHIVRVEDSGKLPDGTLYISMEYLPKGSAHAVFRGRPVPLSRAAKLLEDVCWALEYAHTKGFIHRDIKPANILIGRKGEGKLSDFGLATKVPRGDCASPYGYITHLAPEVIKDGKTSPLTDIYALGVTAYRLINGDGFLPQVPNQQVLFDMIIKGQYPDRTYYRPYVPPKLKSLVNKCMNVDPEQRFDSPSLFRLALERIPIACDWKWQRRDSIITYQSKIDSCLLEVQVIEDSTKASFEIITHRKIGQSSKKAVRKDCLKKLPLEKMKKELRRILVRYVTEGR